MSIGDAFSKGFYGDDVYDESKVYILFDKIGGVSQSTDPHNVQSIKQMRSVRTDYIAVYM